MKSIISNDGKCFIHQKYLHMDIPGTEEHHCIHGWANRKLADQDGLTVKLCYTCHRLLHDKGYHDKDLQAWAQMAWMEYNNKSIADFIARYGKSYL